MLLLNIEAGTDSYNYYSFNTSYVVIKLFKRISKTDFKAVSIHLMLLLNTNVFRGMASRWNVSIHLMLLLNTKSPTLKVVLTEVSIHLMLLLNSKIEANEYIASKFQYILCCY